MEVRRVVVATLCTVRHRNHTPFLYGDNFYFFVFLNLLFFTSLMFFIYTYREENIFRLC